MQDERQDSQINVSTYLSNVKPQVRFQLAETGKGFMGKRNEINQCDTITGCMKQI